MLVARLLDSFVDWEEVDGFVLQDLFSLVLEQERVQDLSCFLGWQRELDSIFLVVLLRFFEKRCV